MTKCCYVIDLCYVNSQVMFFNTPFFSTILLPAVYCGYISWNLRSENSLSVAGAEVQNVVKTITCFTFDRVIVNKKVSNIDVLFVLQVVRMPSPGHQHVLTLWWTNIQSKPSPLKSIPNYILSNLT